MGGFRSAMLLLLVTPELIQGGFGPLREAHGGDAVSSVELAREPRRAASERPQRPVIEAPPRVYLGESPRAAPHQASDGAVLLDPPRGPLFEYAPTVKVAPIYPPEAALACVEGWVLLEFKVTNRGAVRDPIVIEASHPGVFDRAAIQAVRAFRYMPKTVNGVAVEVRGVRYLVPFRLPVDACPRRDNGTRPRPVAVDSSGEELAGKEALQALLREVAQSFATGDLEGSWAAYREFFRGVPPAHADWYLLSHCRSCPYVQVLAPMLGKTTSDLDFHDRLCPRQESGARPRGWICDQLLELLFRKNSMLGRSPGSVPETGQSRMKHFYVQTRGDLRAWLTVGWEDYRFPVIVDTGSFTTVVSVDDREGPTQGQIEDLGTSVEGIGYYGPVGPGPEVVLHDVSVGRFRFQAVPAVVRDLSYVGMNVLLRYPAVCFSWATQQIHLGELGPCAGGLTPWGARLSAFSPVIELETPHSPRTRVLVDTGSDRTACSAAMVAASGRHFQFGDHEDMWLSCEHDDAYFLEGLPWYDALTGMDTLSRFDAFGWRLHPFTMYFVPKADNRPYADSSSPASRRANRARMIPASNSTQVGSASRSCDTTSGGVSSMPTMKQTTMM